MALPRRLLTAALTVLLVVLASLSPAPADVVSRPDLKVAKGSVALSPGGERIKGRFTVRNAGSLPARASTSYVQARVSGKWRYVTELRILALAPRTNAKYVFNSPAPGFLQTGSHKVRVCLDVKKKVKESREGNNCLELGTVTVPFEHEDVEYQPGDRFFHVFPGGGYYGWVPEGYDDTGASPSALFVWLHGCGGHSEFDIYSFHAPPADDYITIAPLGAEGGCWSPPGSGADEAKVSAAIADAAEHFAIDPTRIVLGGYSSGGDLAYRYAYHHSALVDAVLVANSAPFKDTGLSAAQAIAAAATKFRVVHLAHTEDDVYKIADVRAELQVLEDNDFPVTTVERPGTHYDQPGPGVPGTEKDIQDLLLPHVDP